jgi:orotate phosphoribosyltransferase
MLFGVLIRVIRDSLLLSSRRQNPMGSNPDYRKRLKDLILQEGVRFVEGVTLSKGGTSTYYIDCRMVTTHPEGAFLIAEMILDLIEEDDVVAVGGPTLGADPIVGAVCYASRCRNRPLRGFLVRKEEKKHGMQKLVEGQLPDGGRVVVVEDVVTSGGSVLEAIRQIEARGATVVRVIAVVDRLQGARKAFEDAGYRFTPLFTREELGIGNA